MASPQASQHFLARNYVQMLDIDADYSTAAVVTTSVLDMANYEEYVAILMSSALTGNGITLLELIGCTTSDGTGSITSLKTTGTVAADAVGDYVMLSVTADELRQEAADAGAALRYVAVRLTNANAADEAVGCIIGVNYKFGPSLNLSSNTIS